MKQEILNEVYTGQGVQFALCRKEGGTVYRSEPQDDLEGLEDKTADQPTNKRMIRHYQNYAAITIGDTEVVLLTEEELYGPD